MTLPMAVLQKSFDENQHPRANDGKFAARLAIRRLATAEATMVFGKKPGGSAALLRH